MNKKLVALAIAGLLAAPLVQAQTANVVLYGRAHLDMEVVSGQQTSGNNPNQYRVSSNSSRFGIRGSESLGGGTNAIFQLENSVTWDNGAGTIAGRDSFAGFEGSWGKLRVGRYHAPYDGMHDYFGSLPTGETGILATSALWAQGGQAKINGGFDDRVSNSVRYDSPVMSGLQVAYQYGAGGTAATNEGTPRSNSAVSSGSVQYNNGPLKLAAAFQTNNNFRANGLNDLAWTVTGGWQFPNVYVGLVYEKLDYDIQVTATSKGNLTRDLWGIGVTANVGPGVLYVAWLDAGEGKGSAPNTPQGTNTSRVGGLAKGPDTDASFWEISYNYPLSKRTEVYLGYVKIDNSKNANYIFGVNGYTTAIGGKPGGVILGLMHNF